MEAADGAKEAGPSQGYPRPRRLKGVPDSSGIEYQRMGEGRARRFLGRWLPQPAGDTLWDSFINRQPADLSGDLTPAIQRRSSGKVHPEKTEVGDPATMSQAMKELAVFFGADLVAVAATDPAFLRTVDPDESTDAVASGGEEEEDPDEVARRYPVSIVCAVAAMHDPRKALGIGGQLAALKGATVNFYLSSYIRELGYPATISRANPSAAAVAAGLGKLDKGGRFVTKKHGVKVYLDGVVLTNMPLAPDTAKKAGAGAAAPSESTPVADGPAADGGRGS